MTATGPDPFGPDAAAGGADPAEALATALRDIWGVGAAMMQAAAGGAAQGVDPGKGDDAFRAMAAPAAGVLGAYADLMARVAGGRSGPADSGQPRDPSPALIEASAVAMNSAVRYGQGLSEAFSRHQGGLAQAATATVTGAAEDAAAAEALRAFLREVSDTALREARRLEQELEAVSEAVANGAAKGGPEAPYKRRWAAKP